MPWNQWPHVRGIDGHMFMESMATCAWNTHAEDPGFEDVRERLGLAA